MWCNEESGCCGVCVSPPLPKSSNFPKQEVSSELKIFSWAHASAAKPPEEGIMRICAIVLSLFLLAPAIAASAQHLELGGFGSYGNFDLPPFPASAVGLGGRVDVGLVSHLALEGEASYDFKHPSVQILVNGLSTNVTTLRLGVVHENGGFKVQSKKGSFFLFFKGGILNFLPDVRTTTVVNAVTKSQPQSGNSLTESVFYPGGGISFYAGPLGMRVDAGDEIYWDNGAHHNLRVTFGPTIRF